MPSLTSNSTVNLLLPQFPEISTGDAKDIYDALVQVHNAIEILLGATALKATVSALTDGTTGTANGSLVAVVGSGADAAINDNFKEIHTIIDELRAAFAAT